MKQLSNYLIHLELDMRQALTAKRKVDELFSARQRAFERAKEELRDVSKVRATLNQQIAEVWSERFQFGEEADDWGH